MVQDNLNGNLRREELKIWVWPLHTGGYGKPFLRMRNLFYLLSDSPWQNGNACFYCPPYPLHLPQASQGKKLYSSARIHVFLDSVNCPSQKTEHIVEYRAYSRIKTMPSIDSLPPAPAQHLLLCYLITKATIYFKLDTAIGNLIYLLLFHCNSTGHCSREGNWDTDIKWLYPIQLHRWQNLDTKILRCFYSKVYDFQYTILLLKEKGTKVCMLDTQSTSLLFYSFIHTISKICWGCLHTDRISSILKEF